MEEDRNLTDADVKAIAKEMKEQFYSNLGKGVWSVVWKAIIAALIAIAYYGMNKS